MAWKKLGRIYGPDGSKPLAHSHAALPVPVALGGDNFRVFFSSRDASNRSSIAWVDVVLGASIEVVAESQEPVLQFSTPGHFDDSGLGIGSIVHTDREDRLYYMGWNLGILAPWRNSIGVAGGTVTPPRFERLFEGPIMDRSPEDPFTLSYPFVMRLAQDDWRMWYGSNLAWGAASSDMQHVIKAARSKNGLDWQRDAAPAVGFSQDDEYALARPCVLFEDGKFRMWFATRGERYRIGAAVSNDGAHWTRCDEAYGLRNSATGWDSEMVCYPYAFRHNSRLLMLYNGNAYGKDGFGAAVWED